MPKPSNLIETEISLEGGYYPSVPSLSPKNFQNTINAGSNCWVRSGGEIEVANGLLQTSSTNVGARLFTADIQRASIAGGLTGNRLPYAGLLRYQNAVLFFLSENTSSQVYLDESAPTGLTTSSTAGRLRVAIPDGSGGYDTFDAGFDRPIPALVQLGPGLGVKDMRGRIGIALCRWRSATNAISPPSDTTYFDVPPNTSSTIGIQLPTAVNHDGWVIAGTRWGDRSGTLRVLRYVYETPRGTFTATNGNPNLTAGVNTRWRLDLGPGDGVIIDGGSYQVDSITSDTELTLTANFTGSTGSGKTMTVAVTSNEWFDGELLGLVNRDIQAPPRAAGVLQYGGRVFIWGVGDTNNLAGSLPTGPAIFAMEEDNPEHIGTLAIVTASGSDLVNVLAGDGPMYLMTTTSLEVVNFTGSAENPYVIRIIAEPGFKAATNGVLYKDYFYGFSNKPLRTRAENNIDVEFAKAVWEDMRDWDAERVMLAVDPGNDAILYMFDDGTTTTVLPYMAQLGVWGPPLNFSARIVDSAVVNGKLYVTYLSGGNYRVQEWEGGTGIGGTPYVASQFLNPNFLNCNRLKRLNVVGKLGSLTVYAVRPGETLPDVTDLGDPSAVTFNLTDTLTREPEIRTNIQGDAFAFRFDFVSSDGEFQTLSVGGLARGR